MLSDWGAAEFLLFRQKKWKEGKLNKIAEKRHASTGKASELLKSEHTI